MIYMMINYKIANINIKIVFKIHNTNLNRDINIPSFEPESSKC